MAQSTQSTTMTSEPSTVSIYNQSEKNADDTEAQAVMFMLSFLSVIGTAGNALVLYVFIRRKDRLVSTVYIISLAIVDFITCLVVIPFTVYMEHIKFVVNSNIVCKTYQFLITSNIPFSALIMVAIAVDRYLCICHPWRSASMMNVRRAKIVVGILGIFAMSIGVIVSLMYGVDHPISTSMNGSAVVDSSNHTSADGLADKTTVGYGAAALSTPDSRTDDHTTDGRTVSSESLVNTGQCETDGVILGDDFLLYYQRAYFSVYVICFVVVAILYAAIFWSVTTRRNRKQRQRCKQQTIISMKTRGNGATETVSSQEKDDTQIACSSSQNQSSPAAVGSAITEINSQHISNEGAPVNKKGVPLKSKMSNGGGSGASSSRRQQQESTLLANLRTAAMLFVVTVVFVVTFTPGLLMSLEWLPFNMTGFYLYFAYNVANPVIYSFMNPNFRADLRRLVCRDQ